MMPFTSPMLLVEEQQVTFHGAGAYWLDTAEFERNITLARQMNEANPDLAAAALGQALELYRGELMEGYFAEWCLAERERLHQLYLPESRSSKTGEFRAPGDTVHLHDVPDLGKIPKSLLDELKIEAAGVITNTRSSIDPFLT